MQLATKQILCLLITFLISNKEYLEYIFFDLALDKIEKIFQVFLN